MCSTHNPKKYYFATRQKVCIRFTFVNDDSMSRSFMIDISEFQEQGTLAITKAILYLQTKGFNVQKYQIFLPQLQNMQIDFDKTVLIPFEKLPKKQLFLHLQRKNLLQKDQQQTKKTKEPQRYIYQVIQKVKQWRKLFDSKKMSLKEAALVVNVPKKSLDDYFLLLRQGQILGFEYDKNLNNKMGQLRAFIKSHSKKLPNGKLPQQMGNLKCYNLVLDYQDETSSQTNQKVKKCSFEFKQMRQNLKLHPMDLDDNCNYSCGLSSDSD